MEGFWGYLLAGLAAYLLGSLNFGVIVSHLCYRDDIRRHGSGNAGTTNALRTYGKGAAAAVLVGDFLKGTAAVWLGCALTGQLLGGWLASLLVVLGHMFPVFFGFRGGKGVATAAGAILLLNPYILLGLLAVFVLIIACTRYVSLASVVVAGLFPVLTLAYGLAVKMAPQGIAITAGFALAAGGLVIWKHRTNIQRLRAGTESRLGAKKAK